MAVVNGRLFAPDGTAASNRVVIIYEYSNGDYIADGRSDSNGDFSVDTGTILAIGQIVIAVAIDDVYPMAANASFIVRES